jgi:Domain of unknown function (DUF4350)
MTTLHESTAATSTTSQWWRRWRTTVAAGALIVLVGLVIAAIAGGGNAGDLDPDAPTHNGSRALAHLLRDQGVDVRRTVGLVATTTQAGPNTTILVIDPDSLSLEQIGELRSTGADLVVVAPDIPEVVAGFLPGAELGGDIDVKTRDPGCALPAAQAAGRSTAGGRTYEVPGGQRVTGCYADGDASLLQVVEADGRTVTLLGSGTFLRNDHLVKQGNAALAMDLLGANQRLLWEIPLLADSAAVPKKTLTELLPNWVTPTFVELAIAVLLVAAWRARRLGPVVEEPLPVVVRAAEVTEGRARMYRRAKARDRAAEELRRATVERLAPLFGMTGGARTADLAALAAAAAERTGRTPEEVSALLYGGIPVDDAALVALADDLDRLDREVRRS